MSSTKQKVEVPALPAGAAPPAFKVSKLDAAAERAIAALDGTLGRIPARVPYKWGDKVVDPLLFIHRALDPLIVHMVRLINHASMAPVSDLAENNLNNVLHYNVRLVLELLRHEVAEVFPYLMKNGDRLDDAEVRVMDAISVAETAGRRLVSQLEDILERLYPAVPLPPPPRAPDATGPRIRAPTLNDRFMANIGEIRSFYGRIILHIRYCGKYILTDAEWLPTLKAIRAAGPAERKKQPEGVLAQRLIEMTPADPRHGQTAYLSLLLFWMEIPEPGLPGAKVNEEMLASSSFKTANGATDGALDESLKTGATNMTAATIKEPEIIRNVSGNKMEDPAAMRLKWCKKYLPGVIPLEELPRDEAAWAKAFSESYGVYFEGLIYTYEGDESMLNGGPTINKGFRRAQIARETAAKAGQEKFSNVHFTEPAKTGDKDAHGYLAQKMHRSRSTPRNAGEGGGVPRNTSAKSGVTSEGGNMGYRNKTVGAVARDNSKGSLFSRNTSNKSGASTVKTTATGTTAYTATTAKTATTAETATTATTAKSELEKVSSGKKIMTSKGVFRMPGE